MGAWNPAVAGEFPHEVLLAEGWRVSAGYGSLSLDDGREAGGAATITIGNGALIRSERGARWDFEAGAEYTRTVDHPRDADDVETKVDQKAVYYQARRLLGGSGGYVGWHVAMTLLTINPAQGPATQDITTTLGPVAGWLSRGGRLALRLEALGTDPSSSRTSALIGFTTQETRALLSVRF